MAWSPVKNRLRTSQEGSVVVSILGVCKTNSIPDEWQFFLSNICPSLCDYKRLASSSSATIVTPLCPQVISVSCPRFLKTYIVSWEQLLMNVQDEPIRWDCLPGWDTLSSITGLKCLLREKGKRRKGKYFVIIKIKVLINMAWVELSWGRQASWEKSDRQCRVHQGGSKLNRLWSGFNRLLINLHISHLSCTTPLFICKCWICEQLEKKLEVMENCKIRH